MRSDWHFPRSQWLFSCELTKSLPATALNAPSRNAHLCRTEKVIRSSTPTNVARETSLLNVLRMKMVVSGGKTTRPFVWPSARTRRAALWGISVFRAGLTGGTDFAGVRIPCICLSAFRASFLGRLPVASAGRSPERLGIRELPPRLALPACIRRRADPAGQRTIIATNRCHSLAHAEHGPGAMD
jgi:hypothetical protein